MRIAFIADIHSNWYAFEAVLDDIDVQDVDQIVLVGDAINGGPSPRMVLDAIYARDIPMVIGNHEDYILQTRLPEENWALPREWGTSHWTADHLTTQDWDFLAQLPVTLVVDEMFVTHAAPHDLYAGVMPTISDDELAARFDEVAQDVVVTAHTHLPFVINWRDKLVVNPGSVGMPLDGNPKPSYAILTRIDGRLLVQHRRVDYDMAANEQAFQESGILNDNNPFAGAFYRQMREGYPCVNRLVRQIQQTAKTEGLSLVEAIRRADLSQLETDTEYGN
jgi:putative phosphoesterase